MSARLDGPVGREDPATRGRRVAMGVCGLLGLAALGIYFSVPFPLPPPTIDGASLITRLAGYRPRILLDAGLQAIGASLTVIFFLGVVSLAKPRDRFWESLTVAFASVTLGLALLDAGLVIAALQSADHGHADSSLTAFEMTFAMSHVFQLAPSVLLPLGAVLIPSRLLPRGFGYLAVALGAAFAVCGVLALFSDVAGNAYLGLLIVQELWLLGVALILIFGKPEPADLA